MMIGILSCATEEKEMKIESPKEASFKVKPPIEEEVPLAQIFTIDNSLDTILVSDRGSFVSIPKNCFIE